MDTLRMLRPGETIYEYHDRVEDKKHDIVPLMQTKLRNKTDIMIVKNHSSNIVDIVLNSVNAKESGYIFMRSEIDTDPINSPMVPLHRLAEPNDLNWLDERGISYDCLPVLRMTDPIRRWHNFPLDYVVVIERPGNMPYFRRVEDS